MAINPGTIRFKEISTAPTAPAPGYGIIYMKTDNVLYIKDSSGAEVAIGTSYGVTGISGDGHASGPGIASLTIDYVGGQSAANIAAATVAVQQATAAATAFKIVQRDVNGDFHAHMIFSDVTGNLRGNADTATTSLSTIDFTGTLDGDVSGPQDATVVDKVGGKTAFEIGSSVTDTQQATSANTTSKIVKRDAGGAIQVTSVNGVAPEAHAARHLPAGADPLTTAAPTTNLSGNTGNGSGSANSLSRSDHSHAIDTAAPVTQNPDQANSAGASAALARADHVHNIPADVAVGLNADSANTEGVGSSFARADHTHDLATGTPITQAPDQANAEGSSSNLARADHVHNIPAASPTTTLSPAVGNAEGVGSSFARADHTHAIATGITAEITTIQPDDAAAAGIVDKFARADHRHAIAADSAIGLARSSSNTEGASTSFARADHTHNIASGVPSTQTPDQANAAGTSNNFAKADHIHNIPTAAPTTNLDAGTGNADGSAASFSRSNHSHAISTGAAATQTPNQTNAAGTSTNLARADHVHNVPTAAPVTQTADQSNADGIAATFSKSDHVHNLPTAAPIQINADGTNIQGVSGNFAKADHKHDISTAAAVTQTPDQLNAAGSSSSLARADHVHNIPATAPTTTLDSTTSNAEGTAASFARGDHTHAIASAAPVTQTPDQANAAGSSASFAKADHVHNIPADAPTTTLSPATANAEGSGTSFARNDHTHAIATGLAADITTIQPDASASAGTLDKFARADHRHAIDAAPAVTQTPDQTNAEGSSTSFARADHVHNIPSGSVVQIGTSNFDGAASSFAKSDHVHSHGNQTNQNLHALATPSTHGFQSATDKAKSDAALPASLGSSNQVLGVNNAGTAGEYKTLSGTANQIAITDSVGGKTFSTPQNIHAGATPTFAGENLTDRLEMTEQIAPSTPAATKLDVFVESSNGFSRIRALDSTGLKSTILRDNIFLFKNTTGSALSKGQVVYANGADAGTGNLTVALAKADSSTTVPALGLVLDATASGGFGRVMSIGIITGIDTSAFAVGDRVYLSTTTAGALTNVKPSAPNIWQRIGVVLQSNAVTGSIEVRPLATHGEELGTNANTFSIGDNTAGAKTIQVLNSATSAISWNPTAARTLTLPDITDVIVGRTTTDTLTNKRVQGGSLDSAAGIVGYDITNKLFKDPNGKYQLDLGTTLQTSALIADANVIAQLHKNINGSAQALIQNINTGSSVSTDFIANADTATDVNNYLDLGINGSNYSDPSWTINGALDAYLYNNDNGLAIGTVNPTTGILQFFTGGTLAANERARFNAGQGFQLKTSLLNAVVAVTDGATLATDASLGTTFTVTLGGNRTLSAPTNPTNGQKITYRITQDATGSRTLAFDAVFNFGSLVPSLTLTTTPNKTDYIGCIYNSSSAKWDVVAISKGF